MGADLTLVTNNMATVASTSRGPTHNPHPSFLANRPQGDLTADNHFIIMHPMTPLAAFAGIAAILQLECTKEENGFNIGTSPGNLPPNMVPTLQQLIIPHRAYIDMLPSPHFRDRLLNSASVINEPELIHDMMSGSVRIWGKVPWDPIGWEVDARIAVKWSFLMDDDIVKRTNFWRRQRDEEDLPMPSLQQTAW